MPGDRGAGAGRGIHSKICWHWQQGTCTFGDRCKFSHGEDDRRAGITRTRFARYGSPSYGIVPWVQSPADGDWYFLAQLGYSSSKYDLKLDPLRGQAKENETPWQTAVRECREESG